MNTRAGPHLLVITTQADGADLFIRFSSDVELLAAEEDRCSVDIPHCSVLLGTAHHRFMVCCLADTAACDEAAYGAGWSGVLGFGSATGEGGEAGTSAGAASSSWWLGSMRALRQPPQR